MKGIQLNDISHDIIGASYIVHSKLGPGLLESTYETCLEFLLLKNGYFVERQKALPINFMGNKMEYGYRIDLLVENQIIVEVKSVEEIAPIHRAQLMTYLKLSKIKLGLLMNFNVTNMQTGINRIAM